MSIFTVMRRLNIALVSIILAAGSAAGQEVESFLANGDSEEGRDSIVPSGQSLTPQRESDIGDGGPAGRVEDRFVWIFGWSLHKDGDVREIAAVLETAAKHGFNGVVLSAGLDRLCKQPPEYFRRLEEVKQLCERNGLEWIPAIFSVGYGGGILAHDRNLAEGLPVVDVLFVVKGGEARHVPDPPVHIVNGGFEEFEDARLKGFDFHDKPGVISLPDTQVAHSGGASLRFENFKTHPAGNARVMQELKVHPRRSYRMNIWIKTEGLRPAGNFRLLALAQERDLAARAFSVPSTTDWRKVTMVFNSLDFDTVRLYAGVWDGREGKFWLDDWTIEEIGPINVLRRPGTPVTVRSEDGSVTYEEGRDFAPLQDPNLNPWHTDHDAPSLKILPGGRIRDGERLRVSWYHPMVIHRDQVTVCMAEPALYDIFEHEAQLLWERLRPHRVLLNMDEVRMGGSCRAKIWRRCWVSPSPGRCASCGASTRRWRFTSGRTCWIRITTRGTITTSWKATLLEHGVTCPKIS